MQRGSTLIAAILLLAGSALAAFGATGRLSRALRKRNDGMVVGEGAPARWFASVGS